jgi:hypothetical protein
MMPHLFQEWICFMNVINVPIADASCSNTSELALPTLMLGVCLFDEKKRKGGEKEGKGRNL